MAWHGYATIRAAPIPISIHSGWPGKIESVSIRRKLALQRICIFINAIYRGQPRRPATHERQEQQQRQQQRQQTTRKKNHQYRHRHTHIHAQCIILHLVCGSWKGDNIFTFSFFYLKSIPFAFNIYNNWVCQIMLANTCTFRSRRFVIGRTYKKNTYTYIICITKYVFKLSTYFNGRMKKGKGVGSDKEFEVSLRVYLDLFFCCIWIQNNQFMENMGLIWKRITFSIYDR